MSEIPETPAIPGFSKCTMNDTLRAVHCANSTGIHDDLGFHESEDFPSAFGNAVNSISCGLRDDVKWHCANPDLNVPVEFKKTVPVPVEPFINIPLDFPKFDTSKLQEISDNLGRLKLPEHKFVKDIAVDKKEEIAKETMISVMEITNNITISNERILTRENMNRKAEMYNCADTAVGHARNIFVQLDLSDFARGMDGISHVLNFSKSIDGILTAGTTGFPIAFASLGALGAFSAGLSLVNTLFGPKPKGENTGAMMMMMYNALKEVILHCFNQLTTKLYELEKKMDVRFDKLEIIAGSNHYREYEALREIYLQNKDLKYYLANRHEILAEKIEKVDHHLMKISVDLKACMNVINNNFNSFRFEKINELFAEIDYNLKIGSIKDANVYISKLYHIIINLVKNDYITGAPIFYSNIDSKIDYLEKNSCDMIINYFAKKIGYGNVVNPIIWMATVNYTLEMINMLSEMRPFHHEIIDTLRTQCVEINEFLTKLASNNNYESFYNKCSEDNTQKISEFMTHTKTKKSKDRQVLFDGYKSELLGSLTSLLHMSLFNHYTDVARRLRTGYFPKNHGSNTRKLCDRYGFGSSVVRFVLDHPTQQYCGSNNYGDNHPGCWCAMHTHFNGLPKFTNDYDIKSAVNFISDKPDDSVKNMRTDQIRDMVKTVESTDYSGIFRPYMNVHYMDHSVKLPIPKINVNKDVSDLIDYDLGIFEMDVYYTKTDANQIVEEMKITYKKSVIYSHKKEITKIPTNENNVHETIIDLVLGGIYNFEGESLNLYIRTWNHCSPAANIPQTLAYGFPTLDHNIGLSETELTIEIDIDTEKISSDSKDELMKEFEKTDDFVTYTKSVKLGKIEEKIISEMLKYKENPFFCDTALMIMNA
jgi:hypothetical protein